MLNQALNGIPVAIRKHIVSSYLELKTHLSESRHDAAGLSAGKLCEAGIRLLQERAFGQHTPFGKKIANFADECRRIVSSSTSTTITDSEKVVLPRALVFLYTMRNTRGIGHIGGDVDPNAIDAALIGRTADWIVCELIRIHHHLSLEEAQDIVDALAIRQLPDVWEVAGKRRVLRDGLIAKDQALLLLYSAQEGTVLTEDLVAWIEYSNTGVFKSKVLSKLHSDRFVEWDREVDSVTLSPKGAKYVEETLLLAAQPIIPPDLSHKTAQGR